MPYGEIRPIDRSCGSYRPGHQAHWIQAKKSVEEQQPVIDVAVDVHDDGRVELEADQLHLTMWNHDPETDCSQPWTTGVPQSWGIT